MQLRENREHVWAWTSHSVCLKSQPPKTFEDFRETNSPWTITFLLNVDTEVQLITRFGEVPHSTPTTPCRTQLRVFWIVDGETVNPLLQALKPPVRQSRDIY